MTRIKEKLDAAVAFTMPEPQPLIAPAKEPRPYPIDALPAGIRRAVMAYQVYGQQPVALVAGAALASLSLCAQGLVNVGRDAQLVGPISLNIITVATSGERKTSCDKRMCQAPRQWQADRRAAMAPYVQTARARIAAHTAQRDGLLAKIKTGAGRKPGGNSADLDDLRRQLERLEAQAEGEPVLPALFHEDVTPEGLAQYIAMGWPSSSLWSDEAGLVIGAHGMSDDSVMRYLALLNRVWDGNSFERKRAAAKSFIIRGRRMTVSLMMQEVVLARLLTAGGGASRGLGFLARFLIAWPVSTMGTRLYRSDFDAASMTPFDARLRELLDLPLPNVGQNLELVPPVLPLSAAARTAWIAFHDETEQALGATGEFAGVADFAAKTAENAARIAALIHVFEQGPYGEVSGAEMEAAAAIAAWHLFEAHRIIGVTDVSEPMADARLLLDWLLKQDELAVSPREILRSGPNRLRDKKRRDTALKSLVETHHVFEQTEGEITLVVLNPVLRRPA
jgi:putative DNA primase/helicase